MKFKDISLIEKAKLIGLLLTVLVSLSFLIFALVYANPENIYKKYAFLIGIGFIVISRVTLLYYKNIISRKIN
jgi:multidrug transporter EmrE-like cation transporter